MSTPRGEGFRKETVKPNDALCTASVHAKWMSKGEEESGFNPTVTLHGCFRHFLGGLQNAGCPYCVHSRHRFWCML